MPFVRLVVLSSLASSCVAVPIVGATVALRAADEDRQAVEGYERLVASRQKEARTAAVIRERWNAANPATPASFTEPAPTLMTASSQPTRRPLKAPGR